MEILLIILIGLFIDQCVDFIIDFVISIIKIKKSNKKNISWDINFEEPNKNGNIYMGQDFLFYDFKKKLYNTK